MLLPNSKLHFLYKFRVLNIVHLKCEFYDFDAIITFLVYRFKKIFQIIVASFSTVKTFLMINIVNFRINQSFICHTKDILTCNMQSHVYNYMYICAFPFYHDIFPNKIFNINLYFYINCYYPKRMFQKKVIFKYKDSAALSLQLLHQILPKTVQHISINIFIC